MKRIFILATVLMLTLTMALLGGCSGDVEEQEIPQDQNQQEQEQQDQVEPESETEQDEVGPWMTDEEWVHLQEYGEDNPEFTFYMPGAHGFEDQGWGVGLGLAHEWGLGFPYEYIDSVERPAEDLAAYNWETVVNAYHEGFHTIYMTNLKTKEVMTGEVPGPCFIQYISTTQPECKTNRGIHVGNTVEELMEAYPEIQAHLDYVNHAAEFEAEGEATGVTDHDAVWMYLPEAEPGKNPNCSILFLTKDDVIVQIDMGDGLDGQLWSPVFTGEPAAE